MQARSLTNNELEMDISGELDELKIDTFDPTYCTGTVIISNAALDLPNACF
jgi:hypothetical protein